MPPHDPFDQAFVAIVVEPPIFPIPLAGSIDKGQISGPAGREKNFLQLHVNLFRDADADEPARCDRISVLNDSNSLLGSHYLPLAHP